MTDLVSFIDNITNQVTEIAWAIFILAWALGWGLKGSPVPIFRVKRAGQDILEDAIFAAFWLAMGSSIFYLITYLILQIGQTSFPSPP